MHDYQYPIVPSINSILLHRAHKIKAAMPIISKFTARTNGSYVKLSHSSIGWSYYSCDPEWGSLQASYLVAELGEALQSFDVRFVALKGIVEGT
jgi:trehalose 6-phosphate synthase/phosphatase